MKKFHWGEKLKYCAILYPPLLISHLIPSENFSKRTPKGTLVDILA